jgi:hypothetical protein
MPPPFPKWSSFSLWNCFEARKRKGGQAGLGLQLEGCPPIRAFDDFLLETGPYTLPDGENGIFLAIGPSFHKKRAPKVSPWVSRAFRDASLWGWPRGRGEWSSRVGN